LLPPVAQNDASQHVGNHQLGAIAGGFVVAVHQREQVQRGAHNCLCGFRHWVIIRAGSHQCKETAMSSNLIAAENLKTTLSGSAYAVYDHGVIGYRR